MKVFTRDIMADAERDLGTRLDWVAVDHSNTGHPHVDVSEGPRTMIRISSPGGLRERAQVLLTLELGPRSDREIRYSLETQIGAER